MVMESPPNPQYVGREFVRQYYTLLNQAPAHLHRFYNNNSSFVHGGLDAPNRETKPVVGQKQIHQKIQQLNFRDCHAKISQVDSQATLGDGVVVQVTGELSNSGQPMRRFTQTFVLAAQSPKKYYVHNDIFRYQDMIFNDEEIEQDSGRSEAEEDIDSDHPSLTAQLQQQTMAYYNATNAVVSAGVASQQLSQPQLPTSLPHQQLSALSVVAETVVNGSAHPEEIISSVVSSVTQQAVLPIHPTLQALQPLPRTQIPIQPTPVPQLVHPQNHPQEEVEAELETVADNEIELDEGIDQDMLVGEEKPPQQEMLDCSHDEKVYTEPKTYATSVKSGSTFASIISTCPSAPKPANSPPPMMNRNMERDTLQGSGLPSGGPGALQVQRGIRSRGGNVRGMSRNDRGGSGRGSFNEDSGSVLGDGERRRMGPNIMQQYSDDQQLFMGNLPHHATEEDLKELFRKFGAIIDLRIHSKPNGKGVTGTRVPNYGFIVFEDACTVQQVLNSRPIIFPSENGQKLNVEEKKTRPRQPMDVGRVGSGNDLIIGGNRSNGNLGGPRPLGPGMLRGGPGMTHHRGGGRGFSRGDGRGGGINRGVGYQYGKLREEEMSS